MAEVFRMVIQTAEDAYHYARENLTTPKSGIYQRRVFRYVKTIDRSTTYDFPAFPQTRSVHQLSTSEAGHLMIRRQSCYTCDGCIDGGIVPCANVAMTDVWQTIDMMRHGTTLVADDTDDDVTLCDLVNSGDVIAIIADDDDEDYYLMKVTKPAHILDTETQDTWGNTFLRGSNIVTGLYFDKVPGGRKYNLIKSRKAIVFSMAICYIVYKNDKKGSLILSEDDHLDILSSVATIIDL